MLWMAQKTRNFFLRDSAAPMGRPGARTVERGQLAQLQALVLIARLVRGHQQVVDHLRRGVHLRRASSSDCAVLKALMQVGLTGTGAMQLAGATKTMTPASVAVSGLNHENHQAPYCGLMKDTPQLL